MFDPEYIAESGPCNIADQEADVQVCLFTFNRVKIYLNYNGKAVALRNMIDYSVIFHFMEVPYRRILSLLL